MLGVLSVLHYDPDHITLVVNNRDASGGSGLDKSQIEAYLGAQATVEVPHDSNAMRQSVARGAPVVLSNPKAPVTGAIQRLADTVVTADQPAPPSSERGGRSRGRPRRILGFARD